MVNSLLKLIHPLTIKEFEKKYYRKQVVMIKGKLEKFKDLFNYDDLNFILNNSVIPHPKIRLYREGKLTLFKDYSSILSAFYEGSTIILDQVNFYNENLRELVSNTSSELCEQTLVNLYLSPPGNSAFYPHYDSHDVYIIQLEGEKLWQIYQQDEIGSEKTKIEYILSKGDLLYIPKGVWHQAKATEQNSLHITLGAPSQTGIDFIQWLLNDLYKVKLWQSAFPVEIQSADEPTGVVTPKIKIHIDKLSENLLSITDKNFLYEKYNEYINCIIDRNPKFNFPLPSKFEVAQNHQIKLTVNNKIKRQLKRQDNTIIIIFWDKILTFDKYYEKLLTYILEQKDFSLEKLQARFKNKIDISEILEIVGELTKEGLVY